MREPKCHVFVWIPVAQVFGCIKGGALNFCGIESDLSAPIVENAHPEVVRQVFLHSFTDQFEQG